MSVCQGAAKFSPQSSRLSVQGIVTVTVTDDGDVATSTDIAVQRTEGEIRTFYLQLEKKG